MKTTALTNRIQRGFTLVELLVVIGILGVLAAALLATLDPLEQIKKGQDTARISVAREYTQALQRYYASKSMYPWDVTGIANCTNPSTTGLDLGTVAAKDGAANVKGCIAELVTAGELKSSFNTPTLPAAAYVALYNVRTYTNNASSASITGVRTCFKPASKSQLTSGTLVTPATGALCAAGATPATNTCYICAQ